MRKINTHQIAEESWTSPKGTFATRSQEISEALGWKPLSHDVRERHPFAVEICKIPPGKKNYPYHSHSAQWEYYHVLSGHGVVRHPEGTTPVEPGDVFLFPPGEPHQLANPGSEDLVVYVIADNPVGESCHYPDSGKWLVRSPQRQVIRSDSRDYFEGEE